MVKKDLSKESDEFTVKQFTRRHKKYIGVWQKGKRGFYAVEPVKKGVTLQKVRALFEKRGSLKKDMDRDLFRIIKPMIYKYTDEDRVGQLRIEILTYNPENYGEYRLRKFLLKAHKLAMNTLPRFKRAYNRYVRSMEIRTKEIRQINRDEVRHKPLDKVYADVVGFGLSNKYGTLRFKVS